VPPDLDGKGVKLEDCLEEYFNTRVDVARDSRVEKNRNLFREQSGDNGPTLLSGKSTIRLVTDVDDGGGPSSSSSPRQPPIALTWSPTSLFSRRATTPPSSGSPTSPDQSSPGVVRPSPRHRPTIQRIVVDNKGRPGTSKSEDASTSSLGKLPRRTKSTIVKAVTMPAWQFFRLIRKQPAHYCPPLLPPPLLPPPLTRATTIQRGTLPPPSSPGTTPSWP